MLDAIAAKATNIPRDAAMVAGYVDGSFAWGPSEWELFPDSMHVTITVFGGDADAADVEAGDMTPADAPLWVGRMRAQGRDPVVYCSLSNWDTVKGEFAARGVAEPLWWIAAYDGDPAIPPGAVAHQYTDNPPENPYDTSSVSPAWPGLPPTKEEEDMAPFVALVSLPTDAPPGTIEAQYLLWLGSDPYKVWVDAASQPSLLAQFPPPGSGQATVSAEWAAKIPTVGAEAPGYPASPAYGGSSASAPTIPSFLVTPQ